MPARSRLVPALLICLGSWIGFGAPAARADLVWTAETGWRIEGGLLSGLSEGESRNALEAMNTARRREEGGSFRLAARAYERVAERFPNSIYAPEAYYRAGKSRLGSKQYYRAFDNFQQAIMRYPNSSRFNEMIGEQYRIASALLDGARNRTFFGLMPGFRAPEKAVEYFEEILVSAPYSDYAPLAMMNIARAHEKHGDMLDSIDALERMINRYHGSLLAPDAYLRLAKAHAALVQGPNYDPTSARDAATYFYDFMIRYPSDPASTEAVKGLSEMNSVLAESKVRMADFYYLKRKNYVAARVLYNDAITIYPDSEVARQAREKLDEINRIAPVVPAVGEGSPAPTGVTMPTSAPAPAEPRRRWYWPF